MPTFEGIDVSHWQGNIDWAKVKASGVQFAIIKAGGSDAGTTEAPRPTASRWAPIISWGRNARRPMPEKLTRSGS